MRWTIRQQLLLPVLLVVIGAIVGSSGLSAYLAADWARQRQEESLGRVVATLTEAAFPLNEFVLKKMSGLSGAEFVLFDADGQPHGASRTFAAADLALLATTPRDHKLADFSTSKTLELSGTRYLVNRLPLIHQMAGGDAPASLAVLYPEERWSAASRQAIYPPLVVGAAAVVVAVVVTTLLARRVVRPLESLRRQAAAVEQGDFRPMPLADRNDEIQDLARSINHMVERLARYEADVRQNERLRTLGQLGAGIAHQLRNAATGARLALDLHRRECPLEPGCETTDVARRQFTLMETYLQRFLTLGRPEQSERVPLDLAALVAEVLPLVRPACSHAGIELQFARPAGTAMIAGDSQALVQLLVNLLLNAVEAAAGASAASTSATTGNGSAGIVRVEVATTSAGRVECRVGDTGPGPAPEVRERLFEPFVSDKPDGTGLGLAVVRQIVAEHQAELSWHRDGSLTQFVVAFPKLNLTTGETPIKHG